MLLGINSIDCVEWLREISMLMKLKVLKGGGI